MLRLGLLKEVEISGGRARQEYGKGGDAGNGMIAVRASAPNLTKP